MHIQFYYAAVAAKETEPCLCSDKHFLSLFLRPKPTKLVTFNPLLQSLSQPLMVAAKPLCGDNLSQMSAEG